MVYLEENGGPLRVPPSVRTRTFRDLSVGAGGVCVAFSVNWPWGFPAIFHCSRVAPEVLTGVLVKGGATYH